MCHGFASVFLRIIMIIILIFFVMEINVFLYESATYKATLNTTIF